MPHPKYSKEEIAARAGEIYERDLRSRLKPGNRGKYLVIDIETGEYEVDTDDYAAISRALGKHADPALFTMRIGYPAATRLGGYFLMSLL
jgi:predicted transcriptional regulator of viral defense system